MNEILDLFLHADELITDIIARYGTLTYLILFAIIFIETGLVVVAIFPGDGLLFSVGILSASQNLDLGLCLVLLSLATILGNTSNFFIGRLAANQIIHKRIAKDNPYLLKANRYYTQYGKISVVFSRFFPFMRTLIPFVAGIAKMRLTHFTWSNIIGGILWIHSYILLGYFFGDLPFVRKNFGYVLAALVLILTLYLSISAVSLLSKRHRHRKDR